MTDTLFLLSWYITSSTLTPPGFPKEFPFQISRVLGTNEVNRFCSPDHSHFLLCKSTCGRINLWEVWAAPCLCLLANQGSIYHLWGQRTEAPGDSLYPFDLWSRRRGRAFLGHANSSRHKCLPHLPPLCVELISLAARGRVESLSKSGGQSMNGKVRLVQESGNDGAA